MRAVVLSLAVLLVAPIAAQASIPDPSSTRMERIDYRAYDGRWRPAWLVLPAGYRHELIPLVISPHGRGVTALEAAIRWGQLPGEGDFALICPGGQGRKLRLYSWGAPGQISDLARMPQIARAYGVRVDPRRIYAVGGSMGGQEVLLLVARHPRLLAGAAVFDPATNMARRYYDFAKLKDGPFLQRLARAEIGGTPRTDPRAYAVRSPIRYANEIARSDVPIQLYWSTADRIIADQRLETGVLVSTIFRDNPHADLLGFRGDWHHTAEMRPFRRLPRALARFGLFPWRDAFSD